MVELFIDIILSTMTLREMSTRNISFGGIDGRCIVLTTLSCNLRASIVS